MVKNIWKKINKKRACIIIALIIISLLSIFVLSKLTSSYQFNAKSIKTLDDKKIKVTELTAAAVGTSLALSAIPGDATTPLANQIMQLSSYLIIVVGAIFLEKMLLTLTGYITFNFIIPISCLLFAIYLFVKKDMLRNLAIKLTVFGLIIYLVVPTSIQISNVIENTYNDSLNQTITEAKETQNMAENNENEETDENKGISGFFSNIKDAVSNIGNCAKDLLEKGKKALNNFIDAIAVFIITTCIIPIVVLVFFIWIVKIVFGINTPNVDKKIKKIDKKVEEKVEEKIEKPIEVLASNSSDNSKKEV